jgi:predicted secreted protein
MIRSKKIGVVAHCILNQNSVVLPYAREMKNFLPFIKNTLENNIGLLQLPCPETYLYGLKRWGHVKDQFEHKGFIIPAREMLEKFTDTLTDYIKAGYEIVGVFGVKGSPSCGINLTCRSNWCGEVSNYKDLEDISSRVKLVEESGIFMELFKEILKDRKIEIPFIDIEDVEGYISDKN